MAFISLKVNSTLEMQVTLVGQESSLLPLKQNLVSSKRVLFKEQTTKCRGALQP
jgi:hypothetical protein